jgi:hypothetical protein
MGGPRDPGPKDTPTPAPNRKTIVSVIKLTLTKRDQDEWLKMFYTRPEQIHTMFYNFILFLYVIDKPLMNRGHFTRLAYSKSIAYLTQFCYL